MAYPYKHSWNFVRHLSSINSTPNSLTIGDSSNGSSGIFNSISGGGDHARSGLVLLRLELRTPMSVTYWFLPDASFQHCGETSTVGAGATITVASRATLEAGRFQFSTLGTAAGNPGERC